MNDVRPLGKDYRLDTVKERLRHSTGGRYDLELLADCARSWNNKDGFRRERARILRYLFGNQWGDYITYRGLRMTEEEYIRLKHNVPLKNNVMVSLWMSVVGLHAKQETEPVCYARSEDSKNLSDMMSSALQTNWQNTYMPDVLDVVPLSPVSHTRSARSCTTPTRTTSIPTTCSGRLAAIPHTATCA